MIFYVYLDPAVIGTAQQDGPLALQLLIGMLRGFLQNCLLVEFENHQVQEEIGNQIEEMPSSFDRKLIKSLLVQMRKRNRFIYCLTPDYSGAKSDDEVLLEQAAAAMIDLAVLTAELPPDTTLPNEMEVTTLATYQHASFEPERSRLASGGKQTVPGKMTAADFMNFHFRKALRFATKIELCDRALGMHFAENYEYTLREFFRWLEPILAEPEACILSLHCQQPVGVRSHAIETALRSGRRGRLTDMTIRVQYYDGSGIDGSLPHERFILTEQIALSIDRGFDFLERKSKRNRDVAIAIADVAGCEAVLAHFSRMRIGTAQTI